MTLDTFASKRLLKSNVKRKVINIISHDLGLCMIIIQRFEYLLSPRQDLG